MAIHQTDQGDIHAGLCKLAKPDFASHPAWIWYLQSRPISQSPCAHISHTVLEPVGLFGRKADSREIHVEVYEGRGRHLAPKDARHVRSPPQPPAFQP